jgi:hypothetical protein
MNQRLAGCRTVFVALSPAVVFDRVFAVLLAVVVGVVVVISVVVDQLRARRGDKTADALHDD